MLRKALGRGCVTIDGNKSRDDSLVLQLGQHVSYQSSNSDVPDKSRQRHLSQGNKAETDKPVLEVAFAHADDWFAAVIKPHGVAVMGDRNQPARTSAQLRMAIASALPPPASRPDALSTPKFVHRIDQATGGLLLVARTAAAATMLSAAFATEGKISKTYIAIVAGRLEGRGTLDTPLDNRAAKTHFVALSHSRSRESGWVTKVQLHPVTGMRP
jgi:23S rRNA-/tRNA-specific pseudouridylate synthase